jgi:hypothetical protein
MKLAATLLALLMGWGNLACSMGSAPPMSVGAACAEGDLKVEIAVGHSLLSGDQDTDGERCGGVAEALEEYRREYERRFGRQQLAGIPIRIHEVDDLRSIGVEGRFPVSGHTYDDAIDLARDALEAFPHELNHVRTGAGHDGWCIDYEPWSEEVLGINQRGYLGCR